MTVQQLMVTMINLRRTSKRKRLGPRVPTRRRYVSMYHSNQPMFALVISLYIMLRIMRNQFHVRSSRVSLRFNFFLRPPSQLCPRFPRLRTMFITIQSPIPPQRNIFGRSQRIFTSERLNKYIRSNYSIVGRINLRNQNMNLLNIFLDTEDLLVLLLLLFLLLYEGALHLQFYRPAFEDLWNQHDCHPTSLRQQLEGCPMTSPLHPSRS